MKLEQIFFVKEAVTFILRKQDNLVKEVLSFIMKKQVNFLKEVVSFLKKQLVSRKHQHIFICVGFQYILLRIMYIMLFFMFKKYRSRE